MRPHEKERLQTIADEIVQTIIRKDEAYASSWKSHGGYSAFFNLDRKYSRVEAGAEQFQFDLFKATIELEEGRDSLEDLIAYALLTLMETYDPTGGIEVTEMTPKSNRLNAILDESGEPGPEYVDQDK